MYTKNTISVNVWIFLSRLSLKKNHIEFVNILCSPEHEMNTKHKAKLELSKQIVDQFGKRFNQ